MKLKINRLVVSFRHSFWLSLQRSIQQPCTFLVSMLLFSTMCNLKLVLMQKKKLLHFQSDVHFPDMFKCVLNSFCYDSTSDLCVLCFRLLFPSSFFSLQFSYYQSKHQICKASLFKTSFCFLLVCMIFQAFCQTIISCSITGIFIIIGNFSLYLPLGRFSL